MQFPCVYSFINSLLILIVLLLTGCGYTGKPLSLDKQFDFISKGREHQRSGRIERWASPIEIYVSPDVGYLSHIEEHLQLVRDITKLTISSTHNLTEANVKFFTPNNKETFNEIVDEAKSVSQRTRRQLKKSNCFFIYKTDQHHHISSAILVIPTWLSEVKQKHCFTEEFTQILGLPNDSKYVTDSIFNDDSNQLHLSNKDLYFLKRLYK
jgi:hypothetical protein